VKITTIRRDLEELKWKKHDRINKMAPVQEWIYVIKDHIYIVEISHEDLELQ
jgi:hypothetical protein